MQTYSQPYKARRVGSYTHLLNRTRERGYVLSILEQKCALSHERHRIGGYKHTNHSSQEGQVCILFKPYKASKLYTYLPPHRNINSPTKGGRVDT